MVQTESNVLAAFSIDHAARITGLSKARLTRWDNLGFFSPEYIGDDDRGKPYARVYSFVDLVGLRTLKILADNYRVPLRELRKAASELKKRSKRPWSEIPLAVVKKKVVFELATQPRNVTDGQLIVKAIPLAPIAEDIRRKANLLRTRDESHIGKTEKRKYIQHNTEVISGTRIPVAAIESFINAGYSVKQIVEEYPSLTKHDIEPIRRRLQTAA